MLVDVSSDSKCRGEGNGLDVITQDCCCRQEWGGERTSKAACQTEMMASASHHSAEYI